MLAGPYGTQMLADHGAEVIKVEALTGDMSRPMPPHRADDEVKAFGGYFQSINRNKSSIALDLKQPQAREILLHLVRSADVLVENFRVGVMERFGLSYERLREENPRLVYATIRGFGDPRTGESPYAEWPAFDVVAQAMGGVMGITGPDGQTPLKIGPGIGDTIPGMNMAFGILAAVHHARRTGVGQFVDVSMVDSILSVCERIVHQYSYRGVAPGPEGNHHPLLCPFGLFQAKDGWVAIACPNESFWEILTQVMGRPEMASDPRFKNNNARASNREEVVSAIEAFTQLHSKGKLTELLGGKIAYGPVYSAKDIVEDSHFRSRDMIAEVEQPGSATPAKIAGVPVKMTVTPGGVHRRAPLLGEHTDEILAQLGFSAEAIQQLREKKVVC
ncbi:CoA transferase [Pseudomonas sp. ICMP22404]|nr:CoA transferase [Pseudomonas sp. ICMP22404]